jgi:dATP pyrophosphohydrolase
VFRRTDDGSGQGVAGGGEEGETPTEAARREAFEEAGIPASQALFELTTRSSIPAKHFPAAATRPPDRYVIPEYAFAVDCSGIELRLSPEHTGVAWLAYGEASEALRWDGNRTALWELNERLGRNDLGLEA